jgi:hypothetical protein
MYTQSFKASTVLGAGHRWGPARANLKTGLFRPPITINSLNGALGAYYTTDNFRDPMDLLNSSYDVPTPILDSINLVFYKTWAFLNCLDKNRAMAEDLNYKEFKNKFKAAKTCAQQREILYGEGSDIFRSALEESRFTRYQPPITINASTKISNEFKIGLGTEIVTEISKSGKFNANVGIQIQAAIEKYVRLKGGLYHEVRLQPEFVRTASRIIKGFNKNRALLRKYNDNFSYELESFMDNRKAAIITGMSLLEAQFDYSEIQKLKVEIGALIEKQLEPKYRSLTPEIEASIGAAFQKTKESPIEVQTTATFYCLRLVRDSRLEIGKKPWYAIFYKKSYE